MATAGVLAPKIEDALVVGVPKAAPNALLPKTDDESALAADPKILVLAGAAVVLTSGEQNLRPCRVASVDDVDETSLEVFDGSAEVVTTDELVVETAVVGAKGNGELVGGASDPESFDKALANEKVD